MKNPMMGKLTGPAISRILHAAPSEEGDVEEEVACSCGSFRAFRAFLPSTDLQPFGPGGTKTKVLHLRCLQCKSERSLSIIAGFT